MMTLCVDSQCSFISAKWSSATLFQQHFKRTKAHFTHCVLFFIK